MGKRTPLDAADVTARLAVREGWSGDSTRISKSYAVDYHDGVRLIVEVAEVAKEMEHHPDVELHWQQVRFSLTTYSAGGVVTELDFKLADTIDKIVNA
ncbi:4a-hydroxytetrahydrobiopterin dehydratase [Embleya sp. NPDC055664]